MSILYCNSRDCRYAKQDGLCDAPKVSLSEDDGWFTCESFDSDCSGIDGYREEYWIRCSEHGHEVRKKRLGRKLTLGEYTFFTDMKNPDAVTESRTGLLIKLDIARSLSDYPHRAKMLAEITDVMSLPIFDAAAYSEEQTLGLGG